VKFVDDHGPLPETLTSELNFTELPRPAFAFDWQVIDDCASCNGDGIIQRGEDVTLLLDVTNTGSGPALDSFAQIKNGADANIFIEKGRFKIGDLPVGQTKTARFQLEVKKGYKGDTFPLKLAILDEPLEEFVAEKLQVPVQDESPVTLEPKKTVVRLNEKAALLAAPANEARTVARAPLGATLHATATTKGFYKVELDKDRFAFVRTQDAREVKAGKPTGLKGVDFVAVRQPPRIQLEGVDLSTGGLVANGDKYTLSGTVTDPTGLLDMYVLVNDQKVFFKAVDPKGAEPKALKFTADFPLKEGNNNVLVVARETPDFASRRTLVIRRRASEATMAQKTPGPQAPDTKQVQ
jgi:carboxyl-terminal processing protease